MTRAFTADGASGTRKYNTIYVVKKEEGPVLIEKED